ncbi:MAG: hypothetical protein V7K69_30150 [Nostoc sp.]|uniref:hypothetical protein n=1 Tax=Nostoc sp. TaxID=1180 RepID=UPI002FFC81E2
MRRMMLSAIALVMERFAGALFSFLETMRLQGKNAVEELFNLLAFGLSPPQVDFPPSY